MLKTQMSAGTAVPNATTSQPPFEVPPRKVSLMNGATPNKSISSFCRAVFAHLIPSEFWGSGDAKLENEHIFYQNVDRFIGLRRFEGLSLHEVSQGLKVNAFIIYI
jgi:telomerase reverse transcriptase